MLRDERGAGAFRSSLGVLRPFNPISWYHPRGIFRVLSRLVPRLPDVSRCLFLTFTINPLFFGDPSAAFEHARQQLRKIFFRLRRGVRWEGKRYQIDAPYCVKVEFHGNEWAHFHVIFRTRRFVPAGLLDHLWSLGRVNVQRITNEHFHYLLKYVTKGGEDLPQWVRSRNRLRVFQSSRGFLVGAGKERDAPAAPGELKRRRSDETLGERVDRYDRTAVLESTGKFSHVPLGAPFADVHAREILPAALDGRYLGGGFYQISDMNQLETWIKPTPPNPQK